MPVIRKLGWKVCRVAYPNFTAFYRLKKCDLTICEEIKAGSGSVGARKCQEHYKRIKQKGVYAAITLYT